MLRHKISSRVLRHSAIVQSAMILTSLFVIFTLNMPFGTASSMAEAPSDLSSPSSLMVTIVDSKWVVNPGGTSTVSVAVINTGSAPLSNVDVHAYVCSGGEILNVGGRPTNKTTTSLGPNEIKMLELKVTIANDTIPGAYSLEARAELPGGASYGDAELIHVESAGVHLKMGPVRRVAFAGSGLLVSVSVANLTSNNLEGAELFSHIYSDEAPVNESGWDGNKQIVSLQAGEIKNFYFALKIQKDASFGDYDLRTRLRLSDGTLVDDATSMKIVSLWGIEQKLDVLENGIIPRARALRGLLSNGRVNDLSQADLATIRSAAQELRGLLVENVEVFVRANAEIYDVLQFIERYGSGITENEARGTVAYVQSCGGLPEYLRNSMMDAGMGEGDIDEIESLILQNPERIARGIPLLGLDDLRSEYRKTIEPFINTAAASLCVEVATYIEERVQNLKVSQDSVRADLCQAMGYDNALYEALKAEDWQEAYDSANALMVLAEGSALRLAAGYESEFEETLNRFVYYYQKGLYYRTVASAALQGDDEWALEAAAEVQGMPFTAGVEISLASGNGGLGSWFNLSGIAISASASSWESVEPWGAAGYAEQAQTNRAASQNVAKLSGVFSSLALTFKGCGAFLDDLVLGLNGGQGSLFEAFNALEGTFGEYRAWDLFGIFSGILDVISGALTYIGGVLLDVFCPGAGGPARAWGVMEMSWGVCEIIDGICDREQEISGGGSR